MFKVGCCTVGGTLHANGVDIVRTHNYEALVYSHPPESFGYVITLIRDPYRQFISAFFEDITTDGYPFKFGSKEDVLKATPSQLVDHFLKFQWKNFESLNLDIYRDTILRHFQIDIYEQQFDVEKGWSVYTNSRCQKIIIATTEHINDFLPAMMQWLGINNFTLVQSNTSEEKWYKSVYLDFLREIELRGGRSLLDLPDRKIFYG